MPRVKKPPEEDTPPFDRPTKPVPKAAGFKLPKTLAGCADALYSVREERLAAQKVVDALARKEAALREHLIDNLPKSEASGIAGKLARASIVKDTIPQVKDWVAFHAYIKRTGSFDLLQKRLSDGAVKERWEAGKSLPGVERFTVVKVSITKV